METLLICIGLIALFLFLIYNGTVKCSSKRRNEFGETQNFQSITPNACVDMMEKGASQDAVAACVQYSRRCDVASDVWHSPIVGTKVANLYAKFGIQRGLAFTQAQDEEFIHEFQKGICVNYTKCSSNAECPIPLSCSLDVGKCQ